MKLITRCLITLMMGSFLWSCDSSNEAEVEENKATEEGDANTDDSSYLLKQGYWIGNLRISKTRMIPFNMEIVKDSVYFVNAEEHIGAKIVEDGAQLVIEMPIFDSEFRISKNDKGVFGFWHNYAKGPDYQIDFTARPIDKEHYDNRFSIPESNTVTNFEGNWETTFDVGSEDAYKALGLLLQVNQDVKGTFLTETGDYRFLQGNAIGDSLYLSAFDGSHAFLFAAEMDGDTMRGTFYSGNHYQNNWVAFRNDDFELRNPDSLTRLKIGEEFSFNFPGIDGKPVAYPSPKYTEEVVIIQLLGSWCPNCMDETKFLTDLHKSYKDKGLHIIGIAFENPETLEGKIERVKELANYYGAEYEFCIGGYASKKEAEEALPALSEVLSFPTTIFIDKDGQIRKIHTGFNGPGTGPYYLKFVESTNKFVQKLLSE
ncbi:TlpA disulfide reductase family protein [Parvicella tangerina]|uniref:Thiol-disulfide oxidoreductase ResA n=1 Tax=Parvicella tangerina TaxID=2829795 RepID=A0A916N9Q6_9FLAO|nr:TlpA disulfide reductase family protein [Parvicella tangerina]CAG5077703.1 Thiol-disulfide oxidoreductase ResA [Parvicella tangerina]